MNIIAPIERHLSALTGLKKYCAAFGLGLLMTLSLPPLGAFYVLLICVPGLIWLGRACPTKKCAFFTGWAFGAGYFIAGLYWISVALFVDISAFWWALPLSVIAGPAALAIFYGFIPLLAWRYRKDARAYAVMMVAGWSFIEWLRGHIFTGFPWNLPGYTWHMLLPVMQANAAVGIYGLTLLTLLWAALPTLPKKIATLIGLSFVIISFAGLARLHLHPTLQSRTYTVRIVQPNIAQSFKWNPEEKRRNFQHHIDLTTVTGAYPHSPTFVIWPETALTEDLANNPDLARYISSSLPRGVTALIGNLRNGGDDIYYNSVIALSKEAGIMATYDKHHLVPFGEYIPFRRYLNMTPVAAGIAMVGDFTPGPGITTLHLDNLPKPSPLVCYEAIFPGAVARTDDRPDWLVNVTNDAWYGKTAGPHQHFEIARVRAIEEGLPLVRAANTGISATVDPLGRILGMKGLGEDGFLDTILPQPLPPTLYSRFGDVLFFLMLSLLAITGETLRRT